VDGTVEPDVVLDFLLGDPAVPLRLIVEAKLDKYPTQYAQQWARQWQAHAEAGEDGDRVFLAAIGGLGKNLDATVQKIVSGISERGIEIKAVAAGWDRLVDALHEERLSTVSPPTMRVIDDMLSALRLADYQHLRLPGDMAPSSRPWNAAASSTLKNFK
jgi:hypothetical protein